MSKASLVILLTRTTEGADSNLAISAATRSPGGARLFFGWIEPLFIDGGVTELDVICTRFQGVHANVRKLGLCCVNFVSRQLSRQFTINNEVH